MKGDGPFQMAFDIGLHSLYRFDVFQMIHVFAL
jgi:hypothetical protein